MPSSRASILSSTTTGLGEIDGKTSASCRYFGVRSRATRLGPHISTQMEQAITALRASGDALA